MELMRWFYSSNSDGAFSHLFENNDRNSVQLIQVLSNAAFETKPVRMSSIPELTPIT